MNAHSPAHTVHCHSLFCFSSICRRWRCRGCHCGCPYLPFCQPASPAKVTAARDISIEIEEMMLFMDNFLCQFSCAHTHTLASRHCRIKYFFVFRFLILHRICHFSINSIFFFIPAFFSPVSFAARNMKFSFENRRDCHQITSTTSHCLIRLGTLSMCAHILTVIDSIGSICAQIINYCF